jgi:hypothetical protein
MCSAVVVRRDFATLVGVDGLPLRTGSLATLPVVVVAVAEMSVP